MPIHRIMSGNIANKLPRMTLGRGATVPNGLYATFLREEELLDIETDTRRYTRTFLIATLVGAIGLFAITIVGLDYLSVAMESATSSGGAANARVHPWIAPFGFAAIALGMNLAIRTTIERARNRRRKNNDER